MIILHVNICKKANQNRSWYRTFNYSWVRLPWYTVDIPCSFSVFILLLDSLFSAANTPSPSRCLTLPTISVPFGPMRRSMPSSSIFSAVNRKMREQGVSASQHFSLPSLLLNLFIREGPLRISSTSSKNGKVYVFLIIKWVFTNLQPAQELSHGYQHLVGKVRSSLG